MKNHEGSRELSGSSDDGDGIGYPLPRGFVNDFDVEQLKDSGGVIPDSWRYPVRYEGPDYHGEQKSYDPEVAQTWTDTFK